MPPTIAQIRVHDTRTGHFLRGEYYGYSVFNIMAAHVQERIRTVGGPNV